MKSEALHELKVPVSSIRGYTQILKGKSLGALTPEQERILERMTQLCDRLTELMERHLQQAAGKVAKSFPLSRTIENTKRLFEDVASQRGVLFCATFPSTLGDLEGSRNDFERILMNLLDNAIKASSAGQRVDLEVAQDSTGVQVSVKDMGRGLSAPEISRVLRGIRLGASGGARKARSPQGRGLLAVQRLLRRWRSELNIQSSPGKGSTFSFHFAKQFLTGGSA